MVGVVGHEGGENVVPEGVLDADEVVVDRAHQAVHLGLPGVIRGVCVDTAFFKGNFPESCSIEVPTRIDPERGGRRR